jgi:hypothetical protein
MPAESEFSSKRIEDVPRGRTAGEITKQIQSETTSPRHEPHRSLPNHSCLGKNDQATVGLPGFPRPSLP